MNSIQIKTFPGLCSYIIYVKLVCESDAYFYFIFTNFIKSEKCEKCENALFLKKSLSNPGFPSWGRGFSGVGLGLVNSDPGFTRD